MLLYMAAFRRNFKRLSGKICLLCFNFLNLLCVAEYIAASNVTTASSDLAWKAQNFMKTYFEAWYLYTLGLLLGGPSLSVHLTHFSSLSDLARMIEGLYIHCALLALGLSLLAILLRMRVSGLIGIVLCCASFAHIYLIMPKVPAPSVNQGQEISLLVANIEGAWGTNHQEIYQNIVETDPDIVFIMENNPKLRAEFLKAGDYPYRLACTYDVCDNDTFSKFPIIKGERARLFHVFRAPRFSELTVQLTADTQVAFSFIHLTKSWIPDSHIERQRFINRINRKDGPLIVAGDFNAAPWSAPLRLFQEQTKVHFQPITPATWPAKAGDFGIPIDHVGVRGAAKILSIEPWLGARYSNHRGLLAKILVGKK